MAATKFKKNFKFKMVDLFELKIDQISTGAYYP